MNFENDKQKEKRLSQILSVTDNNVTEPDKKFLDKLQEKTTAEFITSNARDTKKSKTTFPLWRTIMKSNISKLAAAAVIIIAAIASFFYIGTEEAYAIDQTIAAMRKVTTVHCFINLFTGERMEVWSEVNPETGLNDKFFIDGPEETRVATPIETYTYNKKTNVVKHSKGSLVRNDLRFGRFIEDFVGIAKATNADIQIKYEEIENKKKVILLVLETGQFTLESWIDPDTKLPISMQMIPKGEPQPGQIGQSIEDFTYNEPLPEGIFEFKIPEGAHVEEQ